MVGPRCTEGPTVVGPSWEYQMTITRMILLVMALFIVVFAIRVFLGGRRP